MGDAALRGPVRGYEWHRVTIESHKGTSAALTPWSCTWGQMPKCHNGVVRRDKCRSATTKSYEGNGGWFRIAMDSYARQAPQWHRGVARTGREEVIYQRKCGTPRRNAASLAK